MQRAIVREPKIFLFDEPLSNLDASLRTQMRLEMARLHERLGATIVYVTHDQVEAMTLGDRIAVFNAGRIEQVGPPTAVYRHPVNRFVAGFLGSPQMSFLPGKLVRDAGGDRVRLDGDGPELPLPRDRPLNGAGDGSAVLLGLRPEHMTRAQGPVADGIVRTEATIELIQPTGSRSYATFRLGGGPVIAELQAHDVSRPGEKIAIDINLRRASLFDARSEKAI